MLISCASTFSQEHAAKVVEVLANDQFIIEIGGKQYRTFNSAKVEELANQKDELRVCKANEARFNDKVALADANVIIAEQQRDREKANFIHAMSLYEKERELRTEVMSQTFAHGKVKGFGGWLLRAIDSPYFQFATRVAAPIKVLVTK